MPWMENAVKVIVAAGGGEGDVPAGGAAANGVYMKAVKACRKKAHDPSQKQCAAAIRSQKHLAGQLRMGLITPQKRPGNGWGKA